MKIPIKIIKPDWPVSSYVKKEIECKGWGTESNPAIIEPSENLPEGFILENFNFFIKVQNCFLAKIVLHSCKNIRIENCNIWSLAIQYCSKVSVNKSTIRRTISLWKTNNVKIGNCIINRVKIHMSNSNTIKNCTIKKIKVVTGIDNIFETNRIPEKHLKKLKKKHWYGWSGVKLE
jgi:hypothetical protein